MVRLGKKPDLNKPKRPQTQQEQRERRGPNIPFGFGQPEMENYDKFEPFGIPTGVYTADPNGGNGTIDCANWPDHPACAGTGVAAIPISLDGWDPGGGIVFDECNFGVRFEPSIGIGIPKTPFSLGFSMPPSEILYRFPECRDEEDEGEGNQPPEPPPPDNSEPPNPEITEDDYPDGYEPDPSVYKNTGPFYMIWAGSTVWDSDRLYYKKSGRAQWGRHNGRPCYLSKNTRFAVNRIGKHQCLRRFGTLCSNPIPPEGVSESSVTIIYVWLIGSPYLRRSDQRGTRDKSEGVYSTGFYTKRYDAPHPDPRVTVFSTTLFVWNPNSDPANRNSPPPNPPLVPMPKCCGEDLSRKILVEIKRQNLALGVDNFVEAGKEKSKPNNQLPYAPERLIYPTKSTHGGTVPFKSWLDISEFLIRQIDKAVGILPFRAKVKDADPSKEGDQKVEMEIHSLGEGVKQLLEVAIEASGDTDLTNLITTHILYECFFLHQGAVQTQSLVQAIADYLNFKQKQKRKKIPFAGDPRAGQKMRNGFGESQKPFEIPDDEASVEKLIPKLLKETEVPVKVVELDPKEKRNQGDILQEILKWTQLAGEAATEIATPSRVRELVDDAETSLEAQALMFESILVKVLTSGKITIPKDIKVDIDLEQIAQEGIEALE